ncbi:MAG TPA: sulfur carrier protein ThiS [Opitutaceae bacterium]
MMIKLNDEPRSVAESVTLLELLRELALAERRGIAVALNDSVVPRSGWAGRVLNENDRLLVIHASQGG